MKTINKSSLMDSLNYKEIKEQNNLRVITGYKTYMGYEGTEVTKVMHVIIYNIKTKEIIYSTGNNLRLEMNYINDNIDKILNAIEYLKENTDPKLLEMSLEMNLDSFFYNVSCTKINILNKQYMLQKAERKATDDWNKHCKEVKQLEEIILSKVNNLNKECLKVRFYKPFKLSKDNYNYIIITNKEYKEFKNNDYSNAEDSYEAELQALKNIIDYLDSLSIA